MRIKIEIKKNWLKGEIEKKNHFTKRNKKKIIKRMRTKLKKITYPKPRLNDEIENKLKFYKKMKNKKIKIELEIPINQRTNKKFCMASMNFKKREKRKEESIAKTNRATTNNTCHPKRKKTLWRFQRHDGNESLAIERCNTCCPTGASTSDMLVRTLHTPTTFFFIYIYI